MAVVVIDAHIVPLAGKGEAPFDTAEGSKALGDIVGLDAKALGNGDRSGRVGDIVPVRRRRISTSKTDVASSMRILE
jgi:hypothetical protein